MGEFNSNNHYIYYCGQEIHWENGVALIVNKRVHNVILGSNPQNAEWSVCFQCRLFNITIIQVYAATTDATEAEVNQFYEDLQGFPELTTKKDVFFIIRDWNANIGSQEIPWVTDKFGIGVQNETGQSKQSFVKRTCWAQKIPFSNNLRWLYVWPSPDRQYRNQIDYILCSQKWKSSIQLGKTIPGADWLRLWVIIAKFRLISKKLGKTTWPFRYDLNQIPYDYTVEVMNRFKGLDLVDRMPEELWMEVCNSVQEAVTKTIPKKKKCKKAKWLSEEDLQSS